MIKTDIVIPINYDIDTIKCAISERLPITCGEICEVELLRRTLDISPDRGPRYKCTVAFSACEEKEAGLLKIRNKVAIYDRSALTLRAPTVRLDFRPVVVGSGPAGLFAALYLAEAGARPIILERGQSMAERVRTVSRFELTGALDTECNIQFGEGGAGTFSDGKLKVGSMDRYKYRVLSEFIESGATDDIAFSSTAHLGTDRLPTIISGIREKIVSLGGEFIFGARFVGLDMTEDIIDRRIRAISYVRDGETVTIPTRAVILAIGHSARDTIRMLYRDGMAMEARGFGIGMRIEHPREYINKLVYKEYSGDIMDTASYHLVTHLDNGRSVYSFCMCPGGTVVAATSEEGRVVTNGMSRHDRMADNSNSAILVSVGTDDFDGIDALGGIRLQEMIEAEAYALTREYRAPFTTVGGLLTGVDGEPCVRPSNTRGVENVDPYKYLPRYIPDSIKAGLIDFDRWMPGFALSGATFTGPETRTTSPVRIIRDECGVSPTHRGVYPCGEGAGYSGGIVSSAVDGLRIAERLVLSYKGDV